MSWLATSECTDPESFISFPPLLLSPFFLYVPLSSSSFPLHVSFPYYPLLLYISFFLYPSYSRPHFLFPFTLFSYPFPPPCPLTSSLFRTSPSCLSCLVFPLSPHFRPPFSPSLFLPFSLSSHILSAIFSNLLFSPFPPSPFPPPSSRPYSPPFPLPPFFLRRLFKHQREPLTKGFNGASRSRNSGRLFRKSCRNYWFKLEASSQLARGVENVTALWK